MCSGLSSCKNLCVHSSVAGEMGKGRCWLADGWGLGSRDCRGMNVGLQQPQEPVCAP